MSHQVKHNEEENRFEVAVANGPAVAKYERAGDVITFTHTNVPEPLQGQGIAAAMVRAGLEFARSEKLKVVPQCPYVAAYIQKHREYEDLVQGP